MTAEGLNYDGLNDHSKEVENKGEDFFASLKGAKSADDFGQIMVDCQSNNDIEDIILSAESIPAKHWMEFYELIQELGKNRIDTIILTHFAYVLAEHQSRFFGEETIHGDRRRHFVDAAKRIKITELFQEHARPIYQAYCSLVGIVNDEDLDYFVNTCVRSHELNRNFTEHVAQGLVGLLINLPLPKVKLFVSEAFELLRYEPFEGGRSGSTQGLHDAIPYMTRKTKVSRKRFYELMGIKNE